MPANRKRMQCQAADEPDPMKEAIGSPTVGKLDMSADTETFQEVMAFTGPAPEVRHRTCQHPLWLPLAEIGIAARHL